MYENRGVFDKYYLLSHGTGGPGATMPVSTQGPDFGMALQARASAFALELDGPPHF